MIGIYKITNPKGAVYIGQSKNIDKRWKDYFKLRCKKQPLIYYSLLKYGVDNHTFEVIQECNKDELNGLEYKWWLHYDTKETQMMNCEVPIYKTIPDSVAKEIERQQLETIIIMRIRIEILKKNLNLKY